LVAIVVAVAVFATACGSGDDSDLDVVVEAPAGFEHLAQLSADTNIDIGELVELTDKLFQRGQVTLSKDEARCALEAVSEDVTLLTQALLVERTSELGFDGNASIAVAMIDCAPEAFVTTTKQGSVPLFADEVPDCIVDTLTPDDPTRYEALSGLFAFGNSNAVPVEQQSPLVDLLDACMPRAALAQVFTFGSNNNPALIQALDTDCVADTFAGESSEQLITAMVAGSGAGFNAADDDAVTALGQLFNCVSFTTMFVASAAANGVVVSEETIACLEPQLDELDMSVVLGSGESPPEVDLAFDECLTVEESEAIFDN
jgi:hypothetical protein